jgi:hypothetical protein
MNSPRPAMNAISDAMVRRRRLALPRIRSPQPLVRGAMGQACDLSESFDLPSQDPGRAPSEAHGGSAATHDCATHCPINPLYTPSAIGAQATNRNGGGTSIGISAGLFIAGTARALAIPSCGALYNPSSYKLGSSLRRGSRRSVGRAGPVADSESRRTAKSSVLRRPAVGIRRMSAAGFRARRDDGKGICRRRGAAARPALWGGQRRRPDRP